MSLVADYSSEVSSSEEETETKKQTVERSTVTTNNKNKISKKSKDGPVKIVVDLPSFTEDEESEENKKKTLKNGGGGLLSLLPAPKNPIKDKKTPNKPRLTNIKPNISPTTHDPTVISSSDLKPESSSSEYLSNEHYSYNNWEGSSINTYSNYHHDQSLEHQQIQDNDQTQSEWMPDDEVIQKLGGRRGKEGPIKIKEISAADQMADAWQAQIADITRSSKGSGSGHSNLKPNKVQKRKHNLMYLAYQATAMENDLKEQYATNKKTKRETQAKYGF